MRAHLHVVRRHVDNVLECATGRLQYYAQVLPAGQELRLGIGNDVEIRSSADLAGAENGGADFYGGDIACTLDNGLHRRRDDQFAVCHGFFRCRVEAVTGSVSDGGSLVSGDHHFVLVFDAAKLEVLYAVLQHAARMVKGNGFLIV